MDELARVSTLPYYVITTPDGKPVGSPIGYTKDVPAFLGFLRDGFSAAAKAASQITVSEATFNRDWSTAVSKAKAQRKVISHPLNTVCCRTGIELP
jgi:hypothetical protein